MGTVPITHALFGWLLHAVNPIHPGWPCEAAGLKHAGGVDAKQHPGPLVLQKTATQAVRSLPEQVG